MALGREFLFTFKWRGKVIDIYRHGDRYKFQDRSNDNFYYVRSWKEECRRLSGGKVRFN